MSFADRLHAAVEAVGNPCLLGIDPHLELLPEPFAAAGREGAHPEERADAVQAFCMELIGLAAGQVAAVKPQSAFFELLGTAGARVWEEVVRFAHACDLLVIGDVKRSDIASTASAYARGLLEGLPGTEPATLCDAVTVNPYLGHDSVEPFLEVCRRTSKGVYVLVRTSNAGSSDFQLHGEPPLSERVASAVDEWGATLMGEGGYSSVGAVVGATHPEALARMRELMPKTPLLLPGFGAQGASASDVLAAFPEREHPLRGGIVNSSRGIAFAWRKPENAGRPWKDAARDALETMIAELRSALGVPAR